jgi:DNA-binding LacI/PurR family transcriptional regulator
MKPWGNTVLNRDRIIQALTNEILSGKLSVGSRLPSQSQIAARFKTSRFPVSQAIRVLAARGYIESRKGSGSVVRACVPSLPMAESAILCMNTAGHVYADLTRLLLDHLHELGFFAAAVNSAHPQAVDLIRRAQFSDARFVLVNAGSAFPFDAFDNTALARKPTIAVMAWESDRFLDRVHRVLTDHAAGARLLADHLWQAGHRCVLLAGAASMMAAADRWNGQGKCPARLNVQGAGFTGMWARRGGRLMRVTCNHEDTRLDANALPQLTGPDTPTAVVGIRDVDAWDVQQSLRRDWPEALKPIAIFGNGDTPWSQMAQPPFSSLNWNIDETAEAVCGIIRDIEAGKLTRRPVVRMISPSLVLRG